MRPLRYIVLGGGRVMVGAMSNDGEKGMEARLQADLGRGWQAKFKKQSIIGQSWINKISHDKAEMFKDKKQTILTTVLLLVIFYKILKCFLTVCYTYFKTTVPPWLDKIHVCPLSARCDPRLLHSITNINSIYNID